MLWELDPFILDRMDLVFSEQVKSIWVLTDLVLLFKKKAGAVTKSAFLLSAASRMPALSFLGFSQSSQAVTLCIGFALEDGPETAIHQNVAV